MVKTTDKIVLGVLAVLLVGMSSVFITAFSGNENVDDAAPSKRRLLIIDSTPNKADSLADDSFEDEDETEVPITETPLERASAAALAYIGEGRVTDSEAGDEEGYYEIEITISNDNEVDVHLDENFNVLGTEYENEDDEDD